MSILEQLAGSLQSGDVSAVTEQMRWAIEGKLEPKSILENGLIAAMTTVGDRFKRHQIFLPDVLLAAKAMQAGMDLLKPLLAKDGIPTIGRVVMGTVRGDLHDIGKNLVAIMLKGAGFEVIDLGKDVPPARFIEAVEESQAEIMGMSALLTTTMPVMRDVISLAKERGLRGKTKVIVGGAPLSSEFAREIGADAYCFDGVKAVETVKELLGVS